MVIEQPPSAEGIRVDVPLSQSAAKTSVRRQFRYVDDPICVVSMAMYVLNRFFMKPHHIGGWLVHDYLNDVLCLPIFLPIILRLQSALGIRRHHLPPTLFELIHNWLIFSILYYFVLPRLHAFSTTADPWNSVAYLVGGRLAYVWWRWFYAAGRLSRVRK